MWVKLLRAGPRGWYDLAEAQLRIMAAAVSVVESREPSREPSLVGELTESPFRGRGDERQLPSSFMADPSLAEGVSRVERAILRTARFGLLRPRCLIRSMALQRMLTARGFPDAAVRFGVRQRDGVFESHAWVEWQGRVIGDDQSHVRSFLPMDGIHLRNSSGIR